MSDVNIRTFSDSYVYNYDKNGNGKLIAKEINRKLIEYINSAQRITDKNSEAFSGIKQDVKRQQDSSLMYSILMRDDVVLMVNSVEMPRAFKVFEAIDITEEGKKRKVFIDCTKLIELKNGYYVCKNIFTFLAYLQNAAVYLLYRNNNISLMNNSMVTTTATECYVNCFTFVLDYLRIIGYSESKSKIKYLTALFFLCNIMGKDLDNYTRSTAAKIAKISNAEMKNFELYFDPEDFINIDTFLSMLTENFKLKGLTTETFITRWMFHFSKGTEYAIDLFSSFCVMIMSAYSGTYIVNQKQIEKCCGRNMVKLSSDILKIGSAELDRSYWSEDARDEATSYISKDAQVMAEALKMRSNLPEYAKINKDDFNSKDIVKTKVKNLIKYYMVSKQESKISGKLASAARSAMRSMDKSKVTDGYEVGVLEAIVVEGKKYITEKDKRYLMMDVQQKMIVMTEVMKKDNVRVNKDLRNKISQELSELRRVSGKLV